MKKVGKIFFFQREDGIRESLASRGLGNVYKKQGKKKRHGESKISLLGCYWETFERLLGTSLDRRRYRAAARLP